METQNIVNLLNDSNNESSKFARRRWSIWNNGQYANRDENGTTIMYETKISVITQTHIFL